MHTVRWWCWTPVWPLASSVGEQHRIYFSVCLFHLYSILLDIVRFRDAFSGWRSNWSFSNTENYSWQQDWKLNRESNDATGPNEDVNFFFFFFNLYFSSVTSRDERSKANFCRLTRVTEVPLWKVCGPPGETDCSVPGARVQPVHRCLHVNHMKHVSLRQIGAREFTAAVKSHAPETASHHHHSHCPFLLQTSHWPLCQITNFQNYSIWLPSTSSFFCKNHCQKLQGVSRQCQHCESHPVTGMHRWFCFVVISHSCFSPWWLNDRMSSVFVSASQELNEL